MSMRGLSFSGLKFIKMGKSQNVLDAINYALDKMKVGKLIKSNDDTFDFENDENFKDGDPETIYSIASLYGQEFDNSDEIESALIEKFPSYA